MRKFIVASLATLALGIGGFALVAHAQDTIVDGCEPEHITCSPAAQECLKVTDATGTVYNFVGRKN